MQNEGSIDNRDFVQIDCAPLKAKIVDHCVQWQKKFTNLLNSIAASELKALHEMFSLNTQKLRTKVTGLDHLARSLGLLKQLQTDLGATEARFAPLQQQYKVLEKFEVSVKEEEQILLTSLTGEWEKFQVTCARVEGRCRANTLTHSPTHPTPLTHSLTHSLTRACARMHMHGGQCRMRKCTPAHACTSDAE